MGSDDPAGVDRLRGDPGHRTVLGVGTHAPPGTATRGLPALPGRLGPDRDDRPCREAGTESGPRAARRAGRPPAGAGPGHRAPDTAARSTVVTASPDRRHRASADAGGPRSRRAGLPGAAPPAQTAGRGSLPLVPGLVGGPHLPTPSVTDGGRAPGRSHTGDARRRPRRPPPVRTGPRRGQGPPGATPGHGRRRGTQAGRPRNEPRGSGWFIAMRPSPPSERAGL